MKPLFERLVDSPEDGFVLKEIRGPACNCPWHFHAEFELVYVLSSRGYRIVGDDVTPLRRGDLVFLGPNLPHLYQHEDATAAPGPEPHCLVLQFDAGPWKPLLELPAMAAVRRCLPQASLGLEIAGTARKEIAQALDRALGAQGPRRIVEFLNILDAIARRRNGRTIASSGFAAAANPFDESRVHRVSEYIDKHYHEEMTLRQVARVANMSEGAFSRFFRSHFGQTFPVFLNRLRVGRACRLLAETDLPVTEIALSSGYTSLSNFNRQFRRLKKATPRDFRQRLVRSDRK
jgi:AraC-like DNA-binding protein